ncbi:MAG TPA: hypothetical protein VNZ01_03890 [Solirubrobacteraceae bacterium]|nr:hypothetical protein [Solirubrobacteraceae bacterium]
MIVWVALADAAATSELSARASNATPMRLRHVSRIHLSVSIQPPLGPIAPRSRAPSASDRTPIGVQAQ